MIYICGENPLTLKIRCAEILCRFVGSFRKQKILISFGNQDFTID